MEQKQISTIENKVQEKLLCGCIEDFCETIEAYEAIDIGTRLLFLQRAISLDFTKFNLFLDLLHVPNLFAVDEQPYRDFLFSLKSINNLCFNNKVQYEEFGIRYALPHYLKNTGKFNQSIIKTFVRERFREKIDKIHQDMDDSDLKLIQQRQVVEFLRIIDLIREGKDIAEGAGWRTDLKCIESLTQAERRLPKVCQYLQILSEFKYTNEFIQEIRGSADAKGILQDEFDFNPDELQSLEGQVLKDRINDRYQKLIDQQNKMDQLLKLLCDGDSGRAAQLIASDPKILFLTGDMIVHEGHMSSDNTALHAAMLSNSAGCVQVILEALYQKNISLDQRVLFLQKENGDQIPALCMAMQEGKPDSVVAYLNALSQDQKLSEEQRYRLFQAKDGEGTPALSVAIQEGNPRCVQVYLNALSQDQKLPEEQRSDLILAKDGDGYSALFVAMQEVKPDSVAAYLNALSQDQELSEEQRLDIIRAKDRNGTPALYMAMQEDKPDIVVAYLNALSRDQNLRTGQLLDLILAKDGDGTPALCMAMQEGKPDGVVAYLNALRDVSQLSSHQRFRLIQAENRDGTPALLIAMQNNNPDCVQAYYNFLVSDNYLSENELISLVRADWGVRMFLEWECDDNNHKKYIDIYFHAVDEICERKGIKYSKLVPVAYQRWYLSYSNNKWARYLVAYEPMPQPVSCSGHPQATSVSSSSDAAPAIDQEQNADAKQLGQNNDPAFMLTSTLFSPIESGQPLDSMQAHVSSRKRRGRPEDRYSEDGNLEDSKSEYGNLEDSKSEYGNSAGGPKKPRCN